MKGRSFRFGGRWEWVGLFTLYGFLGSAISVYAQPSNPAPIRYHLDLSIQDASADPLVELRCRITVPMERITCGSSAEGILEWMPLDLSVDHSPIAQQWLEDQKVDYHFSRNDERFRVERFALSDGAGAPIAYEQQGHRYRIKSLPETSGDSLVLWVDCAFRLPSGRFNGFGRHDWGLLLYHFHPRWALCADGQTVNAHWQRDAIAPAERSIYSGSLSLPAAFLGASNVPLPESKLNAWKQGDYTNTAQTYRIEVEPTLRDDWVLAAGRRLRYLPNSNFDPALEQAPWYVSVDGQDEGRIERVGVLEAELQKGYAEETGRALPRLEGVLRGPGLPKNLQADGLWVDRGLSRPYDALDYGFHRVLHDIGPSPLAAQQPFAHSGLARYLAFRLLEQTHPEYTLSGPFRNTLLARFFDTDALPLSYQNPMLYLYLARQGIDQSPADSVGAFSRGGWEALFEAKSVLHYNYLADYSGTRNFRRGVHDYLAQPERSLLALRQSVQYYSVRPLSGFFDTVLVAPAPIDLRLVRAEDCPSVQTVTVRQSRTPAGFPITGMPADSTLPMVDWSRALDHKTALNFPKGTYGSLAVSDPLRYAELNGKDNRWREGAWFPKMEPIRFQPYTSPEHPYRTQLYWLPTVSYNAYDQLIFGLSVYNHTLIPKKLTYRIIPEYSTGTGELIGYASLSSVWPWYKGRVQSLETGLYYRRYHYDVERAYNRFSAGAKIHLRKSHPRSPFLQSASVRYVLVDLERPDGESVSDPGTVEYSIVNARYEFEDTRILRPLMARLDVQWASDFGKLSVEVDRRWMLPNRGWLIVRGFAGTFVYNGGARDEVFGFGWSGTRDYLFDYSFIGRSDETGLWSRQLFVNDGGFKLIRNDYRTESMLGLNTAIPIWKYFGVFGDVGVRPESGAVAWDYGFRIAVLPDFIEFYLPIQSEQGLHLTESNYFSRASFVLDLRLDALIQRFRRGYY